MIEVAATIAKKSISPVHALIGVRNSGPVIVAGVNYDTQTLTFQGFRGRINMETRDYDGIFCFEPVLTCNVLPVREECCDFVAHGFGVPVAPVSVEEEVCNVADSDTDGDLDIRDDDGQPDE